MTITIVSVVLPNHQGCRHIDIRYTILGEDPEVEYYLSVHLTDFLDFWNSEHPDNFKHYLKEKAKELGLTTRQAIRNGFQGIQIEIPENFL